MQAQWRQVRFKTRLMTKCESYGTTKLCSRLWHKCPFVRADTKPPSYDRIKEELARCNGVLKLFRRCEESSRARFLTVSLRGRGSCGRWRGTYQECYKILSGSKDQICAGFCPTKTNTMVSIKWAIFVNNTNPITKTKHTSIERNNVYTTLWLSRH